MREVNHNVEFRGESERFPFMVDESVSDAGDRSESDKGPVRIMKTKLMIVYVSQTKQNRNHNYAGHRSDSFHKHVLEKSSEQKLFRERRMKESSYKQYWDKLRSFG